MTIGEFGERTRLSPKALRLYDQLGLVVPARVDADTGYRLYAEDQVDSAQLVGLFRRLDMPLGGRPRPPTGRGPAPAPHRRPAQRRARHPRLRPDRPPPVAPVMRSLRSVGTS